MPSWTVNSSGKGVTGVWFLSEGPSRAESGGSHDEETETSRSAQLPQQASAGQVSDVGRESKSCILVRLCQLLLPGNLVLQWVAFCLGASWVLAYFHGWTKERRQVNICNAIWTQFLPQQSRILLFIRQGLGGNAIRSIQLNPMHIQWAFSTVVLPEPIRLKKSQNIIQEHRETLKRVRKK